MNREWSRTNWATSCTNQTTWSGGTYNAPTWTGGGRTTSPTWASKTWSSARLPLERFAETLTKRQAGIKAVITLD